MVLISIVSNRGIYTKGDRQAYLALSLLQGAAVKMMNEFMERKVRPKNVLATLYVDDSCECLG